MYSVYKKDDKAKNERKMKKQFKQGAFLKLSFVLHEILISLKSFFAMLVFNNLKFYKVMPVVFSFGEVSW